MHPQYLDFEVEIGRGSGRQYPVVVLRSPAGEARETMEFPFDEQGLEICLLSLQNALLRSGGERRTALNREEQAVQAFGESLFNALISGEVRSRFDVTVEKALQQGCGVRLKLRINSPELAALPWEFLFDGRQGKFICLSQNSPIVRYLELPQPVEPLRVEPPLRILGMIASPEDLPRLNVEREKIRVEAAVTSLPRDSIDLTWLEGGTWRDLQKALRRGPWHVFHFVGHGGFDLAGQEGVIALPNEHGRAEFLKASQLGMLLSDQLQKPLRLAVLNSCEGARGSQHDIFSSTAAILVRQGIPAVLAMQYEITDRAAIELARSFYEALIDGLPVDAAVAEARKSINVGLTNTFEWGTPVLYMRCPDGVLFDLARPVDKGAISAPPHVFLACHAADKAAVEQLAERLRDFGIEPIFDKWNLVPGQPWREGIEKVLEASDACVLFFGPTGSGPWQHEEMRAAIQRRMTRAKGKFDVVPVLLPGGQREQRSRLPSFLAETTWIDFRSSLDERHALYDLISRIRGIELKEETHEAFEDVCPYRGLQAFEPEHARFFFGREALTEWLLNALRPSPDPRAENRFLAIVGPSGSGKSSLARAGLVPAIQEGKLEGSADWPVVICRPGPNPLESLAVALAAHPDVKTDASAVGQLITRMSEDRRTLHLLTGVTLHGVPESRRLVILVDQFEEFVTLCDDEPSRQALIDNLLHAATIAGGKTVVVLTLRADFYPKCAVYPDLAAAFSDHQVLVGPMTDAELRQAIERPAQLVGCQFEPGLVEALLHDVQHQPGALPLLQHALLELWERRDGRRLTLAVYDQIGRLEGALEQRANQVFNSLAEPDQDLCRHIFLRLTQPGEGTEDTKRRASKSELVPQKAGAEAIDRVLQVLAAARLITIDTAPGASHEAHVEVSHEALIHRWSLLRQWIEQDREGLRIHRRLSQAADEWETNNRDGSYLYHGARLADAEDWAAAHSDQLNLIEEAFLQEGIKARNKVRAAEEWGRKKLRRRAFQGFAVGIVATLVAIFAWRSFTLATQESQVALIERAKEMQRLASNYAAPAIAGKIHDRWSTLLQGAEELVDAERHTVPGRRPDKLSAESRVRQELRPKADRALLETFGLDDPKNDEVLITLVAARDWAKETLALDFRDVTKLKESISERLNQQPEHLLGYVETIKDSDPKRQNEKRSRAREVLENWVALTKWLASLRREYGGALSTDCWFIMNDRGMTMARSPLDSDTLFEGFGYRDYFHGMGREVDRSKEPIPQPIHEPHVSHIATGKASGRSMVTFSVPIKEAKKHTVVLGVLGMRVEAGQFSELDHDNKDVSTVLVDARPDERGMPGAILEHPFVRWLLERNEAPPNLYLRGAALDAVVKLARPTPDMLSDEEIRGLSVSLEDYVDPVGEHDPAFAGRWLAAARPVVVTGRRTGLAVIVQEKREAVVEPLERFSRQLRVQAFAAAAVLLVALIALVAVSEFVALARRRRSKLKSAHRRS